MLSFNSEGLREISWYLPEPGLLGKTIRKLLTLFAAAWAVTFLSSAGIWYMAIAQMQRDFMPHQGYFAITTFLFTVAAFAVIVYRQRKIYSEFLRQNYFGYCVLITLPQSCVYKVQIFNDWKTGSARMQRKDAAVLMNLRTKRAYFRSNDENAIVEMGSFDYSEHMLSSWNELNCLTIKLDTHYIRHTVNLEGLWHLVYHAGVISWHENESAQIERLVKLTDERLVLDQANRQLNDRVARASELLDATRGWITRAHEKYIGEGGRLNELISALEVHELLLVTLIEMYGFRGLDHESLHKQLVIVQQTLETKRAASRRRHPGRRQIDMQ